MNFRSNWYSVCTSDNLPAGQVAGMRLLGDPICLFRTAKSGRVGCLVDRDESRGEQLSLGRVEGEHLQSKYQGWEYDLTGRVVKIPQVTDEECKTMNVSVYAYPCWEQGGRIWVWPGEKSEANVNLIPDVSAMVPPSGWSLLYNQHWDANICPLLTVESNTNVSHGPFVHHGTVSNRKQAQVLHPVNSEFDLGPVLGPKFAKQTGYKSRTTLADGTTFEQVLLPSFQVALTQEQNGSPMVRVMMQIVPVSKNHTRFITCTYVQIGSPLYYISKIPGMKFIMKWVADKGFFQDYEVIRSQMLNSRKGVHSLKNPDACDYLTVVVKQMVADGMAMKYNCIKQGDYELKLNSFWFSGWKCTTKTDALNDGLVVDPSEDGDYKPTPLPGINSSLY